MKRICLLPVFLGLLFCLTACQTAVPVPETIPAPAISETTSVQPSVQPPAQQDSYLSSVEQADDQLHTVPLQESSVSMEEQVPAQTDSYLSQGQSEEGTVFGSPQTPQAQTTPPIQTVPNQTDSYLSQGQTGEGAVFGSAQTPQTQATTQTVPNQTDSYLSETSGDSGRVYSTTTGTGKDRYQTDPIPVGKPMPTEPQDQKVDTKKSYTCTFSIECSTILNNLSQLDGNKAELVPSNGVILPRQTVTFYEGESVFDVLQRLCRDKGIHMESSWTPIYNSAYIEGIHNLYEFDCGSLSGWMYRVNGWYPNYGCSRYQLAQGDVVEWRYTCDLGKDIGGGNAW